MVGEDRFRGDLPYWETRVQWWAEHGAGRGTPHVPHQWANGMSCARCGRRAVPRVAPKSAPLPCGGQVGGTVPPACQRHIESVDDAFWRHRVAWAVNRGRRAEDAA